MVLRSRSGWRAVLFGMAVVVGLAFVLVGCFAGESGAEKAGGNSKCYVCHATMRDEHITTIHLAGDVTCDECHGPSIEHMHDEMLMTKPDLLFGRSEVAEMCRQCHEKHEHPGAVEAFRKKWTGRMRPNGRTISEDSVCTDCHGTHNLAKVPETAGEQDAPWVGVFNGSDLSGWGSSDDGSWSVRGGRIYGTSKGGSLLSDAEYEDYQLAVTFRVTEPVRAGIWLRGGSEGGVRVEIFESEEPRAFTGSVLVVGKGLALVNLRSDLFDGGGWNTLAVKVEGGRVQVWLNAEEVGVVHTGGAAKGKIGLYVEKQAGAESGEFCVREVLIQKLDKMAESTTE